MYKILDFLLVVAVFLSRLLSTVLVKLTITRRNLKMNHNRNNKKNKQNFKKLFYSKFWKQQKQNKERIFNYFLFSPIFDLHFFKINYYILLFLKYFYY